MKTDIFIKNLNLKKTNCCIWGSRNAWGLARGRCGVRWDAERRCGATNPAVSVRAHMYWMMGPQSETEPIRPVDQNLNTHKQKCFLNKIPWLPNTPLKLTMWHRLTKNIPQIWMYSDPISWMMAEFHWVLRGLRDVLLHNQSRLMISHLPGAPSSPL